MTAFLRYNTKGSSGYDENGMDNAITEILKQTIAGENLSLYKNRCYVRQNCNSSTHTLQQSAGISAAPVFVVDPRCESYALFLFTLALSPAKWQ